MHRFSDIFYTKIFWRDGRVVDYNGLENRRAERHRGFESLSLRKQGCISTSYVIYTLYYTQNYRLRNDFKERVLNPKIFDLSCNPLSDVNMIGF